jgi:uncharacterized protein YukE
MRIDDGGGGPAWNGSIKVVPGQLASSAPDFEAASGQVLDLMASTALSSEAAGTGITDPGAADAWNRMNRIWTTDLQNLSDQYSTIAGNLAVAGDNYDHADASAVPFVVLGPSVRPE